MQLRILMLAALALSMTGLAPADTVFFKNGTSMDGEVSTPNDNAVAVQAGKARMVFCIADIDRIEKNDKKGSAATRNLSPMTSRHEARLLKETGLTAEQRAEVRKLVGPLGSPDPNERSAARQRLMEKSRELDLYPYLALCLEHEPARFAPELLRALCELSPEKGKGAVVETALHASTGHRAAAIQFLGSLGDASQLELIAQGLVDEEGIVRIAAACGLAALGSQRATPALIDKLEDPDRQVQNACRAALTRIWSSAEQLVEFETRDEWQTFWGQKSPTVHQPVSTASLKPLIEPVPKGAGDYH